MAGVMTWWERMKNGHTVQTGADFFDDISDVRVSEHAVKRYRERVPESNDLSDEQVQDVIRERLAKATFVFDGELTPGNERGIYFVDDGLVLVLGDRPDIAVVTLYPADYGFSPEIDAYISRNLLKGIAKLHQQIRRLNEENRKVMSAVDSESGAIEDRLAVLRAEIELLEEKQRGIQQRKAETNQNLAYLNAQLREEAAKVVFNKRFSVDTNTTLTKMQTNGRKR